MDIGITFLVAAKACADATPGLAAHRPVNAPPYVCDALAGFGTTIDPPQISARFGCSAQAMTSTRGAALVESNGDQ